MFLRLLELVHNGAKLPYEITNRQDRHSIKDDVMAIEQAPPFEPKSFLA